MRRIRYAVAMSLDGYIAGPHGEYDWIIKDPDIDFAEIFSRYDTAVMGRRTFELVMSHGRGGSMPGMKTVVVSRTLRQQDYPDVTILGEDFGPTLTAMRAEPGKDIWLFGGGSLFRPAGFVVSATVGDSGRPSATKSPIFRAFPSIDA
jgi:dihydrofolate reductase